jgi:hypothetical protein
MDERASFWKWYKRSIYALGAAKIISLPVGAVIQDQNSVFGRGQGYTNRVEMFKIVLLSIILIQGALIAIGSIFCSIKIIILVWATSSKLAKLLRTDDRQLVFALRRRMYAYISVLVTTCASQRPLYKLTA